MKPSRAWFGALAACAGVAVAQTAAPPPTDMEPVARIKTLTGAASVVTQSRTVAAAVGSPVFQGSVIQTEKNSSLGLTFKDGTVLSLGADTRMTLDEYFYNPNQDQYKFGASLGKGALNYLSGAIAKSRPEAVSVKTPTALIGVRGTNFVVNADDARFRMPHFGMQSEEAK